MTVRHWKMIYKHWKKTFSHGGWQAKNGPYGHYLADWDRDQRSEVSERVRESECLDREVRA